MKRQNGAAILEMSLAVSYEEIIPLLRIYPREIYVHTKTCTRMYALPPKTENKPNVLQQVNKRWIGELWHFRRKECYSAIKRDVLLTPSTTWINLKGWVKEASLKKFTYTLSERIQKCVMYDVIYMTYLEGQNYRASISGSGVAVGGGWDDKWVSMG